MELELESDLPEYVQGVQAADWSWAVDRIEVGVATFRHRNFILVNAAIVSKVRLGRIRT
jgi:hypothetical protein